MHIEARIIDVLFKQPLSIAGRTLTSQPVLCVVARYRGHIAFAEAAGVFYRGDTGARLLGDAQTAISLLPDDLLGAWGAVQSLAPGGARNALDWALWQLVAAQRGLPAYRLAFLHRVRPLPTMVTLGLASAAAMAEAALLHPSAKTLKLKLEGCEADADRVAAVRRERPDVRLAIDANEGWSLEHLDRMMGVLLTHRVELIEQPLPAAKDGALKDFRSPIPLVADESLQTLDDLDRVASCYQVANIKLDKCGGLSAALTLAKEARRRGLRVMIGCMGGRSAAILPAFIAAQGADLVDLDAPLFMADVGTPTARYADGCVGFDAAAFMLSGADAARGSP
ncbi:enolase C-terminal domain-like protein [Roseateles cavernae]|uniref:enolase C-terminal domain-like protein n=1 Tax=Roseateles cavernae TaxID=3153578 RepID=UPI0032E469B3